MKKLRQVIAHSSFAVLLLVFTSALVAHPLDDVYRQHSAFAESAAPGVVLRRMSLQIRGVIPSAEEVRGFESASPSVRNEQFAVRFLRDPDYAHYWSGVLGSMLRERTDQRDAPYDAYRDWLARSLHENRSYRLMVRDLITSSGSVDQNAAAIFYLRDNADPLEAAEYVSRVFYGRRLSCARCHDHPTDPSYKRRDYYGLASFFSQTFVRKNKLDEIPWNRREDLPVEDRKKYEAEMKRLRSQMNWDKLSNDQRQRLRKQNELPFAEIDILPELGLRFPHTDDSPGGDLVRPVFPDGKPTVIEPGQDRREVLAKWLTAKTNDRFRKVMINRVWTRLMGWGFFTPLDDWGPETKIVAPEVLNHLDGVFLAGDYRIKDLMLYIVTSDAYRRRAPAPGEENTRFVNFIPVRMDHAQVFNSVLRGTNTAAVPHVWERNLVTPTRDLTGQGPLKKAEKDRKDGFSNACEIPKPVNSATFLAIFGAGRREDVDDDERKPEIDQILALMNGQLTSRLWREYGDPKKNSFIVQEYDNTKSMDALFDTIYVSLLSRHPSEKEKSGLQRLFSSRFDAQAGFQRDQVQDLVWSILQSREFIHVY